MSLWTIGESDAGATGDDCTPMALQKRRFTASAPSGPSWVGSRFAIG